MFVKITNGQAQANYTIGDLRKDHPNVSFPRNISDEVLAAYNVFRVTELSAPDYNSRTHRLVTQAPALVDGVWTVSRIAVAKDQAQIDNETAQVAANVRADRDKRIAETDWMVIKHLELNENIPGVWEVYRQALRDVPAQAGFPWDVNWPTKPE
jgi:hypothetical protein